MSAAYQFDPFTRTLAADLLWSAIPVYYRTKDMAPSGRGELRQFIEILSIPLAILRQNIEELHADLFIDTANDWVIPYLAQMVGVTLVFPDAISNRLDVRETIGWRRRKGTPDMLQDLGTALTGQLVVTREGWKLVQMSQNLNLLRPSRVVPDIRPAINAEIADGPLVKLHHAVDIRSISRTTGKYHPRHVIHWSHPTLMFEVSTGTPARLPDPAVQRDFRYAFHPLGEYLPLRARRTSTNDRTLLTDRVPPMHFASNPGSWFGLPGRFNVRLHGISAAVAAPTRDARNSNPLAASAEIMDGAVNLALLDHDPTRFHGPIRVELVAVPLAGALPDTTALTLDVRSHFDLDAPGAGGFVVDNAAAADPARVAMIRLQPVGAAARYFPGATIEIASDVAAGLLANADVELGREGFRRGSLAVRLPAVLVAGDRWLYLSADGSIYEAQSTGAGVPDIPVVNPGGLRSFDPDTSLAAGPGAAWPPLNALSDPDPYTGIPTAREDVPSVLHGGRVVQLQAGVWTEVAAGATCSIVFAASFFTSIRNYESFLRLEWNGPDPLGTAGVAIEADGTPALNPEQRFRDIATLVATTPNQLRLAVRFECSLADAVMAPAEIAVTSFSGDSVLAYLPELACQPGTPVAEWILAGLAGASVGVAIARDGSTWWDGSTINARRSLGQVVPLEQYRALRRRRVHYRLLCPWRNETLALFHEATLPGHLDIDPGSGLFSMALAEPPAEVTVDFQDGYTAHTGARAAAREPELDLRLATPTRLVSASGHLHPEAPPQWLDIPRYASLEAALNAIQLAPNSPETIQFEDCATYPAEDLVWPAGCPELTIQAAERQRPVIQIRSIANAPGAQYTTLSLIGLNFGSAVIDPLPLPPAEQIRIQFCTVNRAQNRLDFQLLPSVAGERVEILRSITAGLRLNGAGAVTVRQSLVDAGAGLALPAIQANEGTVELDRVTVAGSVAVMVIEASESIFLDDVVVEDRFRGCVRYSRVTPASVLPRKHRTTVDIPAFVSVNRQDPAHLRLTETCPVSILRGAHDGSEMGAFHDLFQDLRREGFLRRLTEYTPAGLQTGIIRMD